jgi:hypothetical protein
VHALRGQNFLQLGSVPDARVSFERALALAPQHPTSRAGLAWCVYLAGDPTEAMIQLANLDEARRDLPEDDPWRAWTREQIERIKDHSEKEAWTDHFERKRLMNGWSAREGAGPVVSMHAGAVRIEGVFDRNGTTAVVRDYPASLFVAIEASVWIEPQSNVRAGLLIARERERRDGTEVIGEASVSRQKEGSLQVRLIRSGQTPEITDMEQSFPTGEWVRLRIERSGDASSSQVTLYMDGIPLIEGIAVPSLGRASTPLSVGLFVEGETGRQVDVRMDDVQIVYRK